MIFQRVNRSDAEKAFIIVKAGDAYATADAAVCFDLTAADGLTVVRPATANFATFAGIIDTAIASGSYGLCQVYGYRGTSIILHTDTTQAAGVRLSPVNAASHLISVTTPQYVYMLETLTTGTTTASKKIFIRAL